MARAAHNGKTVAACSQRVSKRRRLLSLAMVGGVAFAGAGVWAWAKANEKSEAWPSSEAQLSEPTLTFPAGFPTRRIYLDAGHGAEGNTGNQGALGQLEQDFTLSLAEDVAAVLRETGVFEVRICRKAGAQVSYPARVAEADAWPADVFVSLHSDVRRPGGVGYSVLWSDDGASAESARRAAFARTIAGQLSALGLPAYGGEEYQGLYAADSAAGVFVDRHELDQRIFVLKKPKMPSVIVETHNARDEVEARRWNESGVRRAFARALAVALSQFP